MTFGKPDREIYNYSKLDVDIIETFLSDNDVLSSIFLSDDIHIGYWKHKGGSIFEASEMYISLNSYKNKIRVCKLKKLMT